jgi:hypothetical protein
MEDNDRRLNSRMHLLAQQDAFTPNKNLTLATRWTGGTLGLRDYLTHNKGIQFVIIDTLGMFADIQDFNDYTETKTKTAAIKEIADDFDIAILAVHHAKKGANGAGSAGGDWMDAALGSQGLVGTSDATIVLQRPDREKMNGIIRATGRDAVDYKENLKLDGGFWVIDHNEAPEQPKRKRHVLNDDDIEGML